MPTATMTTGTQRRRRMMHWVCKCGKKWSEPMPQIEDSGSRLDLPDGHEELTCDKCEDARRERLQKSGYRPSRETCDRMIADCATAKSKATGT